MRELESNNEGTSAKGHIPISNEKITFWIDGIIQEENTFISKYYNEKGDYPQQEQ